MQAMSSCRRRGISTYYVVEELIAEVPEKGNYNKKMQILCFGKYKKKKHRIKKMKDMIIKIANQSCLDGKECFYEINYVIEDAMRSFMKSLKIDNNGNGVANNQSTYYHVVNVVVYEEAVDMHLTMFFDVELSNSKHNKERKLLQCRSTKQMSRHALNNEIKDVEFVGFKIKWM